MKTEINAGLLVTWCASTNRADLFSKTIEKLSGINNLSREDLLHLLNYCIEYKWHEGTVLVEQRLAEFPQEDNEERFEL